MVLGINKKESMVCMLKKIFETKEFRFLLVGILNTLVGYGLYALFLSLHINYLIANTMSTFLLLKVRKKPVKKLLSFFSFI